MSRRLTVSLLALLGMAVCSASARAQFAPAIGPPIGYVPTTPSPTPLTIPAVPAGWMATAPASTPARAPMVSPRIMTGNRSSLFNGDWKSGIGRYHYPRKLNLSQSNNGATITVTGSYSYIGNDQRTYTGTIENGVVTGNTLKFHWTEGQDSGEGTFEMSADGKGFTGTFTSSNVPATNWDGWH